VALAATAIEVVFLYLDALRSAHALAEAAGLDPVSAPSVAASLARAALELPNPPRPELGVDPLREISRARVVLLSLVYKVKVGLTSFVAKTVLRRILGRAAVRVWLAFVSVPVAALWDAAVAFRAVRQARVRTMGPSFAAQAVRGFAGRNPGAAARETALRAVACAIVCSHDLHPNLLALLQQLQAETPPPPTLDHVPTFLAALRALTPAGQEAVLDLLEVAAVIDGRMTWMERRLLGQARQACGRGVSIEAAERRLRRFLGGRPDEVRQARGGPVR
jgi:hypothetical protein